MQVLATDSGRWSCACVVRFPSLLLPLVALKHGCGWIAHREAISNRLDQHVAIEIIRDEPSATNVSPVLFVVAGARF
jgi:hypothetical protein